jgi:hypothetical protein
MPLPFSRQRPSFLTQQRSAGDSQPASLRSRRHRRAPPARFPATIRGQHKRKRAVDYDRNGSEREDKRPADWGRGSCRKPMLPAPLTVRLRLLYDEGPSPSAHPVGDPSPAAPPPLPPAP